MEFDTQEEKDKAVVAAKKVVAEAKEVDLEGAKEALLEVEAGEVVK